ncbi:MAG: hypothetical protein SFZ24_08545 [Planctomycetota bacterium]|nr:hypothetical protein [Planctomycetota bacterium]
MRQVVHPPLRASDGAGWSGPEGSGFRGGAWRAGAVLLLVFLTLVLPVVFTGAGGTSEEADEREYHLPIIRTMQEQWPVVDLVEYESATAPGFHLLMAAAGRLTGSDAAMRWLNVAFGAGLILVCFGFASRAAPAWVAAGLTLPLVADPYVLGATIWLTTDNAALMFVGLALGGAVFVPARGYGAARTLALGAAAACAVGIRQIHVWLAAPVGLTGLLASPLAGLVPGWIARAGGEALPERRSWRHLWAGIVGAALPVGLLAVFVVMWGGLMPRATGWVQLHAAGPNPASPAFGLALVGVLGVFYLPAALREAAVRIDRVMLAAMAIGLTLALVPETAYLWKSRSYGWLWRIVERTPEIGGRSVLIAVLAPLGAAWLVLMYRGAERAGRGRAALILLLSLLGWLGAQTFNSMAWQRYFEPTTLLGLAWLAALATPRGADGAGLTDGLRVRLAGVWPVAGALVLALGKLGLCAVTLYREALMSLR